MSGWMTGVIHKPIAPGANDPAIHPVGVIAHIAVSWSDSLHGYFDGPSNGIESHFYIRFDGEIEQYRSIYFETDANSQGNSFWRDGRLCGFVSVETEGMGEGKWTAAQLASFKKIILFVHGEAPFPLRVCPGPTSPGVGYHRLFRAWNPNSHSCPGNERVVQFNQIIVPWLAAGGQTQEDDMPTPEEIAAAVWAHRLEGASAAVRLTRSDRNAHRANVKLGGVLATSAEIKALASEAAKAAGPGADADAIAAALIRQLATDEPVA